MSKKTVFIIYNDMGLGGIQHKIVDIISYINQNFPSYQTILCLEQKKGIFLKNISPSIKIISPNLSLPILGSIPLFFWLSFQILKHEPSHIISFEDKTAFMSIFINKFFHHHAKIIIGQDILTSKRFSTQRFSCIKKNLISILYPQADKILVQTKIQSDDLQQIAPKSKNIIVSPNWLPLKYSFFQSTTKKDIDILYLGRLDSQKNIFMFIDIIGEIKKQHPCIKSYIVGNGHQKNLLQKYICQKHLEANIKILPSTIHPEKFYSRSKIYLLTSDYEGFPLTVLESIACGCYPILHKLPEIKTFFNYQSQHILFDNILQASSLINSTLANKNNSQKILDYYQKKVFQQQQKNIKDYVDHLLN